jgi:hypothetical protein
MNEATDYGADAIRYNGFLSGEVANGLPQGRTLKEAFLSQLNGYWGLSIG